MDLLQTLGSITGMAVLAFAALVLMAIVAHGVTEAVRWVSDAPGRVVDWVRAQGGRTAIDRVAVVAIAVALLWMFGVMAQFGRDGFGYWTSAVIGAVVALVALSVGLGGFVRQFPAVVRRIPGIERHPRLVAATVIVILSAVAWNGTAEVLRHHPGAELVGGGMWVSFALIHMYLGAWAWLMTLLIRLPAADAGTSTHSSDAAEPSGLPR